MALTNGQDGVELLHVTLRALLPRTRRIAKAVGGDWVTDEDWEEGGQAAMLSMVRQFRETPPEELTFWEANFWEATKRACITELRKFLRKATKGRHPSMGWQTSVRIWWRHRLIRWTR